MFRYRGLTPRLGCHCTSLVYLASTLRPPQQKTMTNTIEPAGPGQGGVAGDPNERAVLRPRELAPRQRAPSAPYVAAASGAPVLGELPNSVTAGDAPAASL